MHARNRRTPRCGSDSIRLQFYGVLKCLTRLPLFRARRAVMLSRQPKNGTASLAPMSWGYDTGEKVGAVSREVRSPM